MGTPVISDTRPPSGVFWPLLVVVPPATDTRFRPSTITMYFCSGANGALSAGSVKVVVVAGAAGRHRASPGYVPSGCWMISSRSRAAAPAARASIDRNSGSMSAAEPPQPRRNERRANL